MDSGSATPHSVASADATGRSLTPLQRAQKFYTESEERRQRIIHQLRASGWEKEDAEQEAQEALHKSFDRWERAHLAALSVSEDTRQPEAGNTKGPRQ